MPYYYDAFEPFDPAVYETFRILYRPQTSTPVLHAAGAQIT